MHTMPSSLDHRIFWTDLEFDTVAHAMAKAAKAAHITHIQFSDDGYPLGGPSLNQLYRNVSAQTLAYHRQRNRPLRELGRRFWQRVDQLVRSPELPAGPNVPTNLINDRGQLDVTLGRGKPSARDLPMVNMGEQLGKSLGGSEKVAPSGQNLPPTVASTGPTGSPVQPAVRPAVQPTGLPKATTTAATTTAATTTCLGCSHCHWLDSEEATRHGFVAGTTGWACDLVPAVWRLARERCESYSAVRPVFVPRDPGVKLPPLPTQPLAEKRAELSDRAVELADRAEAEAQAEAADQADEVTRLAQASATDLLLALVKRLTPVPRPVKAEANPEFDALLAELGQRVTAQGTQLADLVAKAGEQGEMQTLLLEELDQLKGQIKALQAKLDEKPREVLVKGSVHKVGVLGLLQRDFVRLEEACLEAKLPVKLRYHAADGTPKPVYDEYVLFFPHTPHKWTETVASSGVDKAHCQMVRSQDQAVAQLQSWFA